VQEVQDPSGGSISQTLDRRGNVLREVGADGVLIVRTYDSRDRLLTETRVVGQEDRHENGTGSDQDDRCLSQFSSTPVPCDDLTTRYAYNSLGQPMTTTDARGQRTRNTYDQYGQLLTSTDPLGNTTRSEYDPQRIRPAANTTRRAA